MTDIRFTQVDRTTVQADSPDVRFTQARRTTVQADSPDARFTQLSRTSVQKGSPDTRFTQVRRTVIVKTAAVLVQQVTETDLAQNVTVIGGRQVHQASETDTAQAITHSKTATLGQNTETDTAQGIIAMGGRQVNPASETDLAQPITALKTKAIGLNTETDLVQSVTVHTGFFVAIGQASETDTAQPVAHAKVKTLGLNAETDSSQTLQTTVIITTTSPLTTGLLGDDSYSVTIDATGGFGPLTYSVTSGTPPPGFSIDPATGEITGPFRNTGSFSFEITATDPYGNSASQDFLLIVENDPAMRHLGIGVFGLGYTIPPPMTCSDVIPIGTIYSDDMDRSDSGSDPSTSFFPNLGGFWLENSISMASPGSPGIEIEGNRIRVHSFPGPQFIIGHPPPPPVYRTALAAYSTFPVDQDEQTSVLIFRGSQVDQTPPVKLLNYVVKGGGPAVRIQQVNVNTAWDVDGSFYCWEYQESRDHIAPYDVSFGVLNLVWQSPTGVANLGTPLTISGGLTYGDAIKIGVMNYIDQSTGDTVVCLKGYVNGVLKRTVQLGPTTSGGVQILGGRAGFTIGIGDGSDYYFSIFWDDWEGRVGIPASDIPLPMMF